MFFYEDKQLAWKLNKKGWLHVWKPVAVKVDGVLSHFTIRHFMLTDQN